jgi:hypothetical protein
MKNTTIIKTDQFKLRSYGNGLCYELTSKEREASIFLQGEDAFQFWCELEAYEVAQPLASTNCVLSRLWFDYDILAQPLAKSALDELALERAGLPTVGLPSMNNGEQP